MDVALKNDELGMWNFRLRNMLKLVEDEYDYCLIDCSPAWNVLPINALNVENNYAVIPVIAESKGIKGLAEVIGKIAMIRNGSNPTLQLAGMFFTLVDPGWNLHGKILELLNEEELRANISASAFGPSAPTFRLFETTIYRNSYTPTAEDNDSLLVIYRPGSEGSRNYFLLTAELLAIAGGPAQNIAIESAQNIIAEEQAKAEARAAKAEAKKQAQAS
jgi:chromosome partitioning protein